MADNEIFPLFELPPELRDMIYEYVILVKDPNDFLKAACLNEKFYGEVLNVYYREIPFLIWQGNYWNIQESVSINTMSSIRNAKIDLR
jgi:phage-related protein